MYRNLKALAVTSGLILLAQHAAAQVTVPLPQPVPGPTPTSTNANGGLLVSAWTETASVVQYLGLTLDQINEAAMTPDTGLVLDFGSLASFSVLTASGGPINYHVTAAFTGSTANVSTLATTALSTPSTTNGGLNNGVRAIENMIFNINRDNFGVPSDGCSGANPCVATAATDVQYAGGVAFGATIGAVGFTASATIGTPLNFYQITGSGTGLVFQPANAAVPYQNAHGLGQWLLSANGNLTYTIAGGSTVVPLPPAVWLLVSGLLGFTAIGRRKSAA